MTEIITILIFALLDCLFLIWFSVFRYFKKEYLRRILYNEIDLETNAIPKPLVSVYVGLLLTSVVFYLFIRLLIYITTLTFI